MNQRYNPNGYGLPLSSMVVPSTLAGALNEPWKFPIPRTRTKWISAACVWALALISILDLNSVVFTSSGSKSAFSTTMLVLCVAILLLFRLTFFRDLGTAGNLYLFSLATFFAFATRFGTSMLSTDGIIHALYMKNYAASLVIVCACAMGARHFMMAWPLGRLMRVLLLISLLAVCSVFIGKYYGDVLYAAKPNMILHRHAGFYINPNRAGVVYCGAAAVAFAALITEKRKTLVIGCIVLAVVATILTFSRGAILVLAALIFGQLFFSRIIRQKWVIVGALFAAIGFGYIVIQSAQGSANEFQYEERQRSRLDNVVQILKGNISDDTTGGRIQLLGFAVNHCLRRPAMGNGFMFMHRMPENNRGPHNVYLLIMGEAGFVPVIIILGFLVYTFRTAWNCKIPAVRILVLSYLLVFAVASMADHGVLNQRNHAAMMGICFGILAGATELERRAKKRLGSFQRMTRNPVQSAPA